MKRYCEKFILEDLEKKMVFLGGPRQVGKTTLSKNVCNAIEILGNFKCMYFNWDVTEHRQAIISKQWLDNAPLIVFDELHKYTKWKNWIKGVYDIKPNAQQYLVTGSARLDIYKKGEDSLMGRYHHWRLHPLTIDELPSDLDLEVSYWRLLSLGGFPEPFFSGDERIAKRWHKERFDRVLREDVRDLEQIRDIQLLSMFIELLRTRVGGIVTLANLASDLEISPKTSKAWLTVTEKMYLTFTVTPLTRNVARAILKPPKVYFFDNADVLGDVGAKLENLVATTLLKRLHFLEDYYGHTCELHYIRDKDGREVDFAVIIDGVLEHLIEVKHADTTISSSLKYYANKLHPKHTTQIVGVKNMAFNKGDIVVADPIIFFTQLFPAPWLDNYIHDIL